MLSPIWIACGVSALAAGTAVHAWREQTVATSSLRSTFSGERAFLDSIISLSYALPRPLSPSAIVIVRPKKSDERKT